MVRCVPSALLPCFYGGLLGFFAQRAYWVCLALFTGTGGHDGGSFSKDHVNDTAFLKSEKQQGGAQ